MAWPLLFMIIQGKSDYESFYHKTHRFNSEKRGNNCPAMGKGCENKREDLYLS
jgi:hypothetical protein